MPSKDEVILASVQAAQAHLQKKRPKASPWPDKVLERKDGAGYNFSNRTLRPFVKGIYGRMKTNPVLVPVADRFDLPDRLPVGTLLAGKVSALESWIAGDVCGQLGL